MYLFDLIKLDIMNLESIDILKILHQDDQNIEILKNRLIREFVSFCSIEMFC